MSARGHIGSRPRDVLDKPRGVVAAASESFTAIMWYHDTDFELVVLNLADVRGIVLPNYLTIDGARYHVVAHVPADVLEDGEFCDPARYVHLRVIDVDRNERGRLFTTVGSKAIA